MTAERTNIRVQPGELYLVRSPIVLQTILGSCVGVTFRSARLGAGALCHGILPRCPAGVGRKDGSRYVDFSIRCLLRQFEAMGARRQELEVKVFGGADVLQIPESNVGKATVGAMNARVALEVLEEEGISVAASDLGGQRGRTIYFDTETGEVRVHRLDSTRVLEAPTHDRGQPDGRREHRR